MIEYTLIDSDGKMIEFLDHLHSKKINRLAMDFECEFNLHAYGARLCLIQVFDGSRSYIIDAFRVKASLLASLLEDKRIVKLFFAALSDKSLVYKQYGIVMNSVYDQQLLVEALGRKELGLDSVLRDVLGIEVKNKTRYQRYNWTLRPLREDAVQYALTDVRHLFDLNARLLADIIRENKVEELVIRLVKNELNPARESTPRMFKAPYYKKLNPRERERFKQLDAIRDKVARKLDAPPHNVISNDDLASLAQDPEFLNSIRFGRNVGAEDVRLLKQQMKDLDHGKPAAHRGRPPEEERRRR